MDRQISPPPELTRRRSTRAKKLVRMIRRQESYRQSIRLCGLASEFKRNQESISKLNRERESIIETGEKYTVNLWVDPEKRHKLGRRATACEAYLGIIPEVATSKSKIIVAGFVPDGEALNSKEIKIGDRLQLINSKEVNNENIENILTEIVIPKNVSFIDFLKFEKNQYNIYYKQFFRYYANFKEFHAVIVMKRYLLL